MQNPDVSVCSCACVRKELRQYPEKVSQNEPKVILHAEGAVAFQGAYQGTEELQGAETTLIYRRERVMLKSEQQGRARQEDSYETKLDSEMQAPP